MDDRNSKEVENELYIIRVLFSYSITLFGSLSARVQLSGFQHLVVLYSLANINSFQIYLIKDF